MQCMRVLRQAELFHYNYNESIKNKRKEGIND